MKKTVLIIGSITTLVLLIIFSNKQQTYIQKGQAIENIDIHSLPNQDMLLTDGMPDSCQFVKLETSIDCMVGHIVKMIVTDSLIFIKDYNKNLFVFNIEGKFKNKIGIKGNASNELMSLTDFYVDKLNKEVVIYDILKSKMFYYDYNGNLLQNKRCKNSHLNESIDISYYDDKTMILTMTNNPGVKYNYTVLNRGNFSTKKECLPYPIVSETYAQSGDIPKISMNNKKIYASAFLSDTIYVYNADNFTPVFVINSKMKRADSNIINKLCSDCKNAFEAIRILSDKGYSYGISKLLVTDSCLLLYYCEGKKWYKVYLDLGNGGGSICESNISNNIIASGQYITTSSNAFISIIPAYDLFNVEYKEVIESNDQLRKIFSETSAEDNPILCFSYIK